MELTGNWGGGFRGCGFRGLRAGWKGGGLTSCEVHPAALKSPTYHVTRRCGCFSVSSFYRPKGKRRVGDDAFIEGTFDQFLLTSTLVHRDCPSLFSIAYRVVEKDDEAAKVRVRCEVRGRLPIAVFQQADAKWDLQPIKPSEVLFVAGDDVASLVDL